MSGAANAERIDKELNDWNYRPPPSITAEAYSARWTGTLTALHSGRHAFKLVCAGTLRLYLDGDLVVEVTPPTEPGASPIRAATAHVDLVQGQAYDLKIEYVKPAGIWRRELRVLFAYAPQPDDDERIARAVDLARRSDVALIFGGMPRGFESEGADRPHMRLPGRQDELIRAVAQAQPNTVVVLNCGSPVGMPWVDEVPGVVLAYYPGQEGGNAIADVLAGDVNPSGKLSVSYPRRYQDNPTYINYPGSVEVLYGEGIFVGYRYYDTKGVAPLFPFGYGLSYTTFAYGELQVPEMTKLGEPIEVSVTVTNTGDRAGKEVVQLYVGDVASSLARPVKELKGFAKVALEPGASETVSFTLDQRALSFYDPDRGQWVAEPGAFVVLVGGSSRDIRAEAGFVLTA
jgi:beta-glucosidase